MSEQRAPISDDSARAPGRNNADTSFAMLRWRAALPSAPEVPDVEDQIEWAELCLAVGERESGLLLFETAFIRQGFSAQLRTARARLAERSGLPHLAAGDRHAASPGWTTDLAIAELERIAGALTGSATPRLATRKPPGEYGRPDSAAGLVTVEPADTPPGDVSGLARRLYDFLRAPASDETWQAGEQLVAELHGAERHLPRLDYRTFADAPLPVLATAIGHASLRAFYRANLDLLRAPLGSVRLLHASARFDHAALGPYFSNVGRVVRKSRDVLELARTAAGAAERGGADAAETGAWTALLARCLEGSILYEVIDDLGDNRDQAVLGAIFDRAAGRLEGGADLDLIMRLRDTALDTGDYDLSGRAQAAVVQLRPSVVLELEILGSIYASGGDMASADVVFRQALTIEPEHSGVLARLQAARSGAFEPFAIRQGFGSPPDRQFTRTGRRAARRHAPPALLPRMLSVEV